MDSSVVAIITRGYWRATHLYFRRPRIIALPREQVVGMFRDEYKMNLVHVNAEDLFLGELAGVTDPEKKRKTIGRLFIEVLEAEAKN